MTHNYTNTGQNQAESQALVKSDKNSHALTVKGKGSLLVLTDSILSSAIAARQASQLPVDDSWMQRIWEWADEFEITKKQIPRTKKGLLKLRELEIKNEYKYGCILGVVRPTYVPDDLSYLKNLEKISIHNVNAISFVKNIDRLSKLTTLSITGDSIEVIPNSICKLSNLLELEIDIKHGDEQGWRPSYNSYGRPDEKTIVLPNSIGKLVKLRELRVSGRDIHTIPSSIGQLSELTELYINGNFSELPDSIGQLSELTKLITHSRDYLHTIPNSIGQLSELTELYISGNFSELPDSIGQLTKLAELMVKSNKLNFLPDSIGQLSELTKLNLSYNNLSTLPNSIGQLTNLSDLDLSFNNFTILPNSIDQLTKLKVLSIRYNNLRSLPNFIEMNSRLQVRGYEAQKSEITDE